MYLWEHSSVSFLPNIEIREGFLGEITVKLSLSFMQTLSKGDRGKSMYFCPDAFENGKKSRLTGAQSVKVAEMSTGEQI